MSIPPVVPSTNTNPNPITIPTKSKTTVGACSSHVSTRLRIVMWVPLGKTIPRWGRVGADPSPGDRPAHPSRGAAHAKCAVSADLGVDRPPKSTRAGAGRKLITTLFLHNLPSLPVLVLTVGLRGMHGSRGATESVVYRMSRATATGPLPSTASRPVGKKN